MKKYMSFFLLILAMVFTACSSDDEAPEAFAVDHSILEGEWFSDDSNTYLDMAYSSFKGVVYGELDAFPVEGENISGKWIFLSKTNIVRFTIHYSIARRSETRDFKLLRMDGFSMTLLDIELNAEYTYRKVMMHQRLTLGQENDIVVDSTSPTAFVSLSPNVANVSSTGRVRARTAGTAFIYAESGAKSFYSKVDVYARPMCYTEELFGTIDDVLAKYGTPDWTGEADETGLLKVVLYTESVSDTRLRYIHYIYDPETREIAEILAIYVDSAGYDEDMEYLQNNLVDIYGNGSCFGENAFLLNNMYLIQLAVGDDIRVIYFNSYYYIMHGVY